MAGKMGCKIVAVRNFERAITIELHLQQLSRTIITAKGIAAN